MTVIHRSRGTEPWLKGRPQAVLAPARYAKAPCSTWAGAAADGENRAR